MIQIAIMGLGTVGTGVAKVVTENARQIERKLGEPLQVKTILVRHFKDGPYRQLMTDDFTKIEEDHAIRVVVETIGGVEAAYEYTKRALNAGKHVVTANKQLVAEKGAELLALAKKRGVNYLFEASVGGGIPVLHPLTQCMAANRIDEVYGILNGTTNYILTRMVRAGTTFADALKEAQEKGYAEADPTADVEGVDAGRKICILADLAFGCQVDPADVPMEGISRLSLRDVKIAQRAGFLDDPADARFQIPCADARFGAVVQGLPVAGQQGRSLQVLRHGNVGDLPQRSIQHHRLPVHRVKIAQAAFRDL